MGQAAPPADLPKADSPPAVNLASADDLLAQLAGEEIDRLLAESDADAAKIAAPTALELPSPEAPAKATAPAPEPPRPVAAAPLSAESSVIAREQHVAEEKPDPTSRSDVPIPPIPTGATVVETPPAPLAPEPIESPVPAADVPALDLPRDDDTAAETQALLGEDEDHQLDVDDDAEPLPRYIQLLEALNAPLLALPDVLREMIGKIAILTLFNSVAVLLYVIFFRRH